MPLRHLLVKAGPAGVGVTVVDGRWVEETGETTLGEGYALAITFPVDIAPAAPRARASPSTRPRHHHREPYAGRHRARLRRPPLIPTRHR